MKINKIINKKAGISYLEIAILLLATFAFSYLVYSSGVKTVIAQEDPNALVDDKICCKRALNGTACYTTNDPTLCDPNSEKYPVPCESGPGNCVIGCCISETTGLCNQMTPKLNCDERNGTFNNNQLCGIPDCAMGCCFIGSETMWTTRMNCQFEGNSRNPSIPTEWRNDEATNTYLECLYSPNKNKEGACVFNSGKNKTCVYTTFEECVARTGNESNFDQTGKYCSDPSFNTNCKKHDHKGCMEGKEDVYWFDSCGNHEEVAEDCSLAGGTYCGEKSNNYYCRDIDCIVDGLKRMNGESWCEYDNVIGRGKDPAGSRHVRHVCYMGAERIQPCADFRNEICVADTATTNEGKAFSQAACRVNNWRRCLELNAKKNVDQMKDLCGQNPDCWVKHIDMEGTFEFDVCLPSYPPGFELYDENASQETATYSSGDAICDIATQRCTETWVCTIFGCFCVDNCKCHTEYFTIEMNEFCISLGDCGAWINYVDVWTDGGYSVKSTGDAPPRIGNMVAMYKSRAGTKPAKPGNYEFFETTDPSNLASLEAYEEFLNSSEPSNTSAFQEELSQLVGAMGSPLLTYLIATDDPNVTAADVGSITAAPVNGVGYFNAYSSVRSAISAQIVQKETKAGGFEMLTAMIAALIAYIITESILMAFLAAILAYLFALAWIIYVYIDFKCNMWERPSGGSDCNLCNDLEVPCSEYRCQSLGELCQFINQGSEDELCVSRPSDPSLPLIQPLYSVLTPGYKYVDVTNDGFQVLTEQGKCIDPYTMVQMGIGITPFAKCRMGVDPKQKWEEMPEPFGFKGESILPEHRTDIFLMSPEAIRNTYQGGMCNQSGIVRPCNLTEEQIKKMGEMTIYVKCKTADGRQNPDPYGIKTCVNPGPDLTAPYIFTESTMPSTGSYLEYEEYQQSLTIYINEPSNCRWSFTDVTYGEMQNQFYCKQNITDITTRGFPCFGNITGVKNDTKVYIKCQDMSANSNNMTQSYVYTIKVSKEPLRIVDMIPANGEERTYGEDPVTLTLKVETAGGAENGKSTCEWGDVGREGFTDSFGTEYTTVHTYTWNRGQRGGWNITYTCEDKAGNIAQNSTYFKIYIDETGPTIIRIFNEGGIRITTNEAARCKYSYNRNFVFENATEMDSGLAFNHFGPWEDKVYYIQCQDQYGWMGTKIMVRPYETFST